MTAFFQKLYLERGEGEGKELRIFWGSAVFNHSRLPYTSHLLENPCYGEPLGNSCAGVTGPGWGSSSGNRSSRRRCWGRTKVNILCFTKTYLSALKQGFLPVHLFLKITATQHIFSHILLSLSNCWVSIIFKVIYCPEPSRASLKMNWYTGLLLL